MVASSLTFGERLKRERESRDITLREISGATKIGLRYLQALESDDFESLPGGVFNTGYVRAYAQCLGVDPEPLVEAFAAVQRTRESDATGEDNHLLQALAEAAPSGSSGEGRSPRTGGRKGALYLGVVLVSVIFAGGITWLFLRRPSVAVPPGQAEAPVAAAVQQEELQEEELPVAATPEPVDEQPVEVAEATTLQEDVAPVELQDDAKGGSLSIEESGVGTGIFEHELRGRSDRFVEGTAVWFWTKVLGGGAGTSIRHLWIREGVEIHSVELALGGPHWRTQSRKTLHRGSAGRWRVEAQDDGGRVLARHDFICEPARSEVRR